MLTCYFYSPSTDEQTKTGTGESRYLHDRGNPVTYTHSLPLFDASWKQKLSVRDHLTTDMVNALRMYNIPADATPVFITDRPCQWGILVTDRAAYDRQLEHASMGGGDLPTPQRW